MANGFGSLERFFAKKKTPAASADSVEPASTPPTIPQFPSPSFIRPKTSRMSAREEGDTSASSSTCDPKSSMEAPSERSLPLRTSRKLAAKASRLDTPPSSDLEDEGARSPQYFRDKKLPALPSQKPPTPDSSPELRPVHIAQLRASKSIDFLNKSVCRDIRRHFAKTLDQRPLRKAISQTSLEDTTNRISISSSTLREPDFNEFFNLSDDDIAESAPADADAVETSTYATAPDSPRSSLLTLTPPYASKPATAAAFEAARIANRYNFDLVYVVNLWTDHARSNSQSPDSLNSPSNKFGPLSGRLLAAYGLENVNLPFQISTTAHSKILRTPGWIEYRAKEVRNDEFARGYACAFYTGECSRGGSIISRNSSSSTCSVQSMNTDRGIIFAAYRKPRADGSLLGISSSPADLVNVHKDAEALVEMLVDIHVANRLREPQSCCHQSAETGPMPSQRVGHL
ncbi:hypothetical protein IL306_009508 [Fusarium sp. DS 682]|nr:hypothetical protein IL306_009508 [Fusarium sp. DS 682]